MKIKLIVLVIVAIGSVSFTFVKRPGAAFRYSSGPSTTESMMMATDRNQFN